MKRITIIGGETHVDEIRKLCGSELALVGVCMEPGHYAGLVPERQAPNFTSEEELYIRCRPEISSIANANDQKFGSIMRAIERGCDVIADKPLCLTLAEQARLEAAVAAPSGRRLLNLLTLRGNPPWVELRRRVQQGQVGAPAFVHIRMAVRLNRSSRPPWFLDCRRSGGLFLDLLIHGLDYLEWMSGDRIAALTASTGNLSDPKDQWLRDHAAVFCELAGGATALVEGQRMLPDTRNNDYRVLVAGTKGYIDMVQEPLSLRLTSPAGAEVAVTDLPEPVSVVADWLKGGDRIPQSASLRANRLALLATLSASEHRRIEVEP